MVSKQFIVSGAFGDTLGPACTAGHGPTYGAIHCRSFDFGPTMSITDRGVTGPATVVIQGMGVGMISCLPTTFLLVACILSCAALSGAYGVAISAVPAERARGASPSGGTQGVRRQ